MQGYAWRRRIGSSASRVTAFALLMNQIVACGFVPERHGSAQPDFDIPRALVAPPPSDVWGKLPIYFVENQGQTDEKASFHANAGGLRAWFTGTGVTFALPGPANEEPANLDSPHGFHFPGRPRVRPSGDNWRLDVEFVGARGDLRPEGIERTDARFNWIRGQKPEWKTDVPSYLGVRYRDVWPGIDVVYGQDERKRFKSSFVVRTGADSSQIRLAWAGATELRLDEAGRLHIGTPYGALVEDAPAAWQRDSEPGSLLPVGFVLEPETELDIGFVSFLFESDVATSDVTIDPSISYISYIGGSADDVASAITVDITGAAYVAGYAQSSQATFPNGSGLAAAGVPGFDQSHNGGSDAFVVKLAPNGQSLVYATYIGGGAGDQSNDSANALVVDPAGAVYVAGQTGNNQTTFPNGSGFASLGVPGFDQTHNGNWDAFVLKLSPSGSTLIYATYIGGSQGDYAAGIGIDASGGAYVAGGTESTETTFPNGLGMAALSVPGFDKTFNGAGPGDGRNIDAFVVKLSPDGRSLAYATFVGGSTDDVGLARAVDGTGAGYLAGVTRSSEATFPNGGGLAALGIPGFDQTYNSTADVYDGFVVKLAPTGDSLLYATYVGGAGTDELRGLAIDATGAAYIAGRTTSDQSTFPNGAGLAALGVPGFDQTFNGADDAFILKLAPDGTSVRYATFLGGSGHDYLFAIAVDSTGAVFVGGSTSSDESTFPNGSGLAAAGVSGFDQTFNGLEDAYVVKLSPSGASLLYATYMGGVDTEEVRGLAVDASGILYVVGGVGSDDVTFPNGGGMSLIGVPSFDTSYNGSDSDGFIAKLDIRNPGPPYPRSVPPDLPSPGMPGARGSAGAPASAPKARLP